MKTNAGWIIVIAALLVTSPGAIAETKPKGASQAAVKKVTRVNYTPEEIASMSYDVDLRDVAQLLRVPEAQVILQSMIDTPEIYFPKDVVVRADGVHKSPKTRINSVFGIEITQAPTLIQGGEEFKLNTFYQVKDSNTTDNFFFRKITVQVGGSPLQVINVAVTQEIPASQTNFWIRVGLTQTKLVLEDTENGIRKVFPLGVGGFDEGTPAFDASGKMTTSDKAIKFLTDYVINAKISRTNAIAAREKPDYYQKMPFMFITGQKGQWYGLGFHIHPFPGQKLARGYQSHGCMRMREKDLYELYTLLMKGGSPTMPVVILPYVNVTEDSPYPRTPGYHSIYYAPPDATNPKWHTVVDKMEQKDADADGNTVQNPVEELKQTIVKRGQPPIEQLYNVKLISSKPLTELLPLEPADDIPVVAQKFASKKKTVMPVKVTNTEVKANELTSVSLSK